MLPYVGLLGDGRSRQSELQLYTSEFVPLELRRPHIGGAYRACPMSLRACALSAFKPTNETANVWSHVLGCALFARHALSPRVFRGGSANLACGRLLACTAAACFALSATFHLLGTRSLQTYRALHKLDVGGILALIVACFVAGLQLGFACAPRWGAAYQGAVCTAALVGGWRFARADGVPRRTAASLGVLAALGLVPIAHWAVLLADPAEAATFGPHIARFFLLLAAGAGCYASAAPERWAPGRFDVWGHSHTWWHVLVLLAVQHFYATLVAYSEWQHLGAGAARTAACLSSALSAAGGGGSAGAGGFAASAVPAEAEAASIVASGVGLS